MKVVILREQAAGETRVAATPETAGQLAAMGLEVVVEAGAGSAAGFDDDAYSAAKASIAPSAAEALDGAQIVAAVNAPSEDRISQLPQGCLLIAPLFPDRNRGLLELLANRSISAMSLDRLPRITRAQSMDVLSSMSTIAGYKAALLAADKLDRLMPMMVTAAGTLRPAKALVIGAGVAGLQAIATARKLGAIVTGVDVRPAAQEQVKSLGARFVAMEVEHETEAAGGYAADLGEDFYKQEQDILAPHVKGSDIVITTALIPNRPAPKLITAEMVESMKHGSVIIDLAVPAGGNCSLTKADQEVQHAGVWVLGPINLPAAVPNHASLMFSRNVSAFIKELLREGELHLDMDNPIISQTLVVHEGKLTAPAEQSRQAPPPASPNEQEKPR
jgi:NAD(P) transhydrogenase subunit alpha